MSITCVTSCVVILTLFPRYYSRSCPCLFFFFQAEDGIRDLTVTGVQTCALPISRTRIHERPMPVHLSHGDVGVPVGNAALPRVRLEVHAGEAVRGGDEHRPVLVVVIPVRVVLAGTPGCEHGVYRASSQRRREREDQ